MRKMRATIGIVMDSIATIVIYGVIIAAILFMAGQAKHYYDVGYGVFSQQGKDARGTGKVVAFTVEEGLTASRLGEQLEEQGIVASARLFLIQERVSDYAGKYVPGTYALSSEMTTEEIMKVISGTEASPYELPQEETAAGASTGEQTAPAEPAEGSEETASEETASEETGSEEAGSEEAGSEEQTQ